MTPTQPPTKPVRPRSLCANCRKPLRHLSYQAETGNWVATGKFPTFDHCSVDCGKEFLRRNYAAKRPAQPLRLFCVEYSHAGTLYVTVVEAVSEACALDAFTVEHPHVKVVRVY